MPVGPPKITCSVCTIEKGDTNHWYMATIEHVTIFIEPLTIEDAAIAHAQLCGQKCLHVWLDRAIATINAVETQNEVRNGDTAVAGHN